MILGRSMVVVAVVLVLSGCGSGSSDEEATDAGASTTTTTEPLTASTDPRSTTTTPTVSSSTTSSTVAPTTTATTTSTTATTATTDPPPSTLLDGGTSYAFTTPSGNIACVMADGPDGWASCWISEKSWTIEQPDGPYCDESDWGNAVDVIDDGPYFPCYTDFAWDPSAPTLEYGQAVQVGSYRCESATTGVTCRNGSGAGFHLRRAAVDFF